MIVLYSGRPNDGHTIVKYKLEFKVGEEFVESTGLRVLLDGATAEGTTVTVPDRSYEIGNVFDVIEDVIAVKVNVYESDNSNRKNTVVHGIKINDWTNFTLHDSDIREDLDIGLELEDDISTVIRFNGKDAQRKVVPSSVAS